MTIEPISKATPKIRAATMLCSLAGVAMLLTITAGCTSGRSRDVVLLDSREVMPPPYVQPEDMDRERGGERGREPDQSEPQVREEIDEEPSQSLEPIVPEDSSDESLAPPDEEPEAREQAAPADEEEEPETPEEPPEFPEQDRDESELTSHTVQAGESLWSIGQKYGVSYRDIMAYNDIDEEDVLREGQELTIPTDGEPRADNEEQEPPQTTSPDESEERDLQEGDKYTVRRGDSLSVIASDFGVDVDDIKDLNDLDSDRIYEGQTLVMPDSGTAPEADSDSESDSESESETEPDPEDDETEVDMEEDLPEWEPTADDDDEEEDSESETESMPDEDSMDTLEHVVLEDDESFEDIGEMYDVDPNAIRRHNPDIEESDLEPNMTIEIPVY